MLNNLEFQTNLEKDEAIILANIKFDNNEIKEQEENEYILLENPINRINELNY